MIKNNYSATTNYRNPKHCWHKISYYRTPKTSHKSSMAIKKAEKVSELDGHGKKSLYIVKQKK